VATGIQFGPPEPYQLRRAISRTVERYADREGWTAMQRAGMRADFSWDRSAARYAALYRSLIG
jgi:starch synthase